MKSTSAESLHAEFAVTGCHSSTYEIILWLHPHKRHWSFEEMETEMETGTIDP